MTLSAHLPRILKPEHMARRTVHARQAWGRVTSFSLIESTPGYECGDSGGYHWTDGYWAVLYPTRDGTEAGQFFSLTDAAKARALFAEWTEAKAVRACR